MSGRTITAVLLAAIVSVRHAMAAGLYAIAAGACAATAGARARRSWAALCAALAALSIARAFDLADHVGNGLRRIAYTEGWYERRRPLQTAVVVAGVAATCIVVTAIVRVTRDRVGELRVAIVATSGLIVLAALRTVSLHDIDGMLARHDRLVIVAEAGALMIITLAALAGRASTVLES
jgi:hypothetical protein